MRRLIEWIYQLAFGLHIRSLDQHIADLRDALHQQMNEREALNISIDATTSQLLKALAAHDDAMKACGRRGNIPAPEQADTPAIDWDPTHRFPDPAPRSY